MSLIKIGTRKYFVTDTVETQILDLLKTYPIKYKEIGSLLKDGMSILNRYASLFRAQSFSTQMVGHDDYLHVLNCVKSYLDNLKAEREAEYQRYLEIKNQKTT